MAAGSTTAIGRIIYVDVNASGPLHDGTGWCAAYVFLQDALDDALPTDEVRVADGLYRPDRGSGRETGNRWHSFFLANGVTWLGGYPGCAAINANERDPFAYRSVLSGDLAGDDETGLGSNAENSYHVLRASFVDAAVVDGFTIVGGNADGDVDNRGGGLLNEQAWPVIRNCTFRGNVARFGGAINSDGANLTLMNTVFVVNRAGFSGAALRAWQTSHAISNCLFIENIAEAGGAIWFGASTANIRQCTFTENRADFGSAMSFDSCCPQQPSAVEIVDSILWNGGDEIVNQDFSTINVAYTIVAGGFVGVGNIAGDPRFVPGPAGCYYLSQVAAGEPEDSPAVDAGSNSSGSGITRSDQIDDFGTVDMGYHFSYTENALLMGDFDRSLRVDLRDFAAFQDCFSGEGPLDVPPCCRIFDDELDSDVDIIDLNAFGLGLTGP